MICCAVVEKSWAKASRGISFPPETWLLIVSRCSCSFTSDIFLFELTSNTFGFWAKLNETLVTLLGVRRVCTTVRLSVSVCFVLFQFGRESFILLSKPSDLLSHWDVCLNRFVRRMRIVGVRMLRIIVIIAHFLFFLLNWVLLLRAWFVKIKS